MTSPASAAAPLTWANRAKRAKRAKRICCVVEVNITAGLREKG